MNDKIVIKTSGLCAETTEDLDVNYEKFGVCLRKQEEKVLLKKGGPWAALAFKFRDLVREKFGSTEVMLAAFRNTDGEYKRYSYFIIRDKEMAVKIINFLKESFDV